MIHFLFLGGIIGFSSSEGTIQRWELTSHVVAKIKSDMEERVGLKKDFAKPKELQQGRIAFNSIQIQLLIYFANTDICNNQK